MADPDLRAALADVSALIAARLRIRGATLGVQVSKLGRSVPKRIRTQLHRLAEADIMLQNPKLARMVNARALARPLAEVTAYLQAIDPRDRARGRLLIALGKVSALLIAVFIVTVWVLVQRGVV